METVEMATSNDISVENGRLVISTAKSSMFIVAFALLTMFGVAIWLLLAYVNQEHAKPGSHNGTIAVVFAVIGVLTLFLLVPRKSLAEGARKIAHGETITFEAAPNLMNVHFLLTCRFGDGCLVLIY